MVRRAIMSLLRRATAAGTAAAYLSATLAPLYADEMRAQGQAAQSFGLSILPDMGDVASRDGSTLRLWPGAPSPLDVDLDELFPGYAGHDGVDPATLFGADGALRGAAAAAAGGLDSATTPHAEAWRAVTATQSRAGVDMRDDPVFAETRALIGSLDTLVAEVSACVPDTAFTPRDLVSRVTEERRCIRVAEPRGVHQLRHDLNISTDTRTLRFTFPERLTGFDADFRLGRLTIRYTEIVLEYSPGERSGTWVPVPTPRVQVHPIAPWDWGRFCGGDADTVVEPMRVSFTGGAPGHRLGAVTHPDCSNGLTFTAAVLGDGCELVLVDDDRMRYETVCGTSSVDLLYAITRITNDEWGPPEAVHGVLALQAGGCFPALTTLAGGDGAACLDTGGGQICPGDPVYDRIRPPPFDPGESVVDRLALIVDADVSACAPVVPVAESCSAIRTDAACSYRTTNPVPSGPGEGASLDYGIFEDVYDCETARTVQSVGAVGGLACPPPVRGVGDDLVTPIFETNDSFAEVAARLSAAQFMAMDASCGGPEVDADPLQCEVFEGRRRTCSVAFFGVVDCCQNPGGVSLAQYLSLAFAIGEVDGALANVGVETPLRGAWELATTPFSDAWGFVSRNFASGVNSITGTSVFSASDVAAKGLVTTVKTNLLNATAEWTANTFGEAAANALFNVAGGPAFSGGTLLGDVALGPAGLLGSALGWVMTAYTVYQVALLLIQIVWSCSQDELQTAVQRQLRACRDLGTYCSQSVLGVCLQRRRSFCCFNSPLSRIMQEQIRGQTGASWGSARNPDCSGLTVAQMQSVDFAALDLSEWLNILLDSGVIPDGAELTADLHTGSGHSFAGALPAGQTRLNARDRTLGRAEDLDLEAVGRDARDRALGDLAR